jgi:hypothetical protein
MTQCNYCSLQQIKKAAEISGSKVILTDKKWILPFIGGVNVFVVPQNMTLEDLNNDNAEQYFET